MLFRKNMANCKKHGENNPNAKLSKSKVKWMRQMHKDNPTIRMVDLGKSFGVGRKTARKVIREIAW